jgi:hypothetical protein
MAQFDDISDGERRQLADQAAPLLLQLQGPRLGGPGAPMVLGNSLCEYMMTPQWILASDKDAAQQTLLPTGQTFSIVQSKDDSFRKPGSPDSLLPVVGFVRHSTGSGKNNIPMQITAVSGSAIAERIRDGIEWINANVPGDPIIRVLTAPAYHLTALGLYAAKDLTGILVVTPVLGGLPLQNEHVYSPSEFRGLMRNVPPAGGITP